VWGGAVVFYSGTLEILNKTTKIS